MGHSSIIQALSDQRKMKQSPFKNDYCIIVNVHNHCGLLEYGKSFSHSSKKLFTTTQCDFKKDVRHYKTIAEY
jgi:hypothetical protein